ncbi:MAG: hypothetical protein ABEH35_03020 [Haloarculaceae archaeon]
MTRRIPVIAVAVLVVSALAALPMAGVAAQTNETDSTPTETPTPTATPDANETANDSDANASVGPGAQLAGVVSVQEAEIEGDVQQRTFGIKIAQAATANAKAEVVGQQLGEIEQRLQNLSERKQELREARENGSMSEGEFRAKMARLHAETQTTKQLTNDTANVTEGLPEETLRENGINVTAIQTLKERASELSGPEVAKIARSIAGPNVGKTARPAQAGPPANVTDGERGPPENTTGGERGPPENQGPSQNGTDGNETTASGNQTDSGQSGTQTDGTQNGGQDNSGTQSGNSGQARAVES